MPISTGLTRPARSVTAPCGLHQRQHSESNPLQNCVPNSTDHIQNKAQITEKAPCGLAELCCRHSFLKKSIPPLICKLENSQAIRRKNSERPNTCSCVNFTAAILYLGRFLIRTFLEQNTCFTDTGTGGNPHCNFWLRHDPAKLV